MPRAPKPKPTTPLNADVTDKEPNHTAMLSTPKLTEVEKPRLRSVGRPAKPVMPDLPKMPLEPTEQALFDFFIAAYKDQYPDMVPTDHLLLHLAGLEYVKYLRVIAEELETGKVISMARQHPGVNMRALLDQLSVTRKARTAKTKTDDTDEARELRDFFMGKARG